MVQKILQVGTSAAVTISKESLSALNFNIGDRVEVDIDKKRKAVIVKPLIKVDSELLDWTNKFIDKYRSALEELARK